MEMFQAYNGRSWIYGSCYTALTSATSPAHETLCTRTLVIFLQNAARTAI